MAGGGYYPTMTDLEWANAPWNESEVHYDICPECDGDGGVWYDEDGKEYGKADYNRMSEEERTELEFKECERCEGKGKIEVEPYKPDYDDYDD